MFGEEDDGSGALDDAAPPEEEPEDNSDNTNWGTVAIVTSLVLFSIAFEKGQEKLREATSAEMRPVLNAMLSEVCARGISYVKPTRNRNDTTINPIWPGPNDLGSTCAHGLCSSTSAWLQLAVSAPF